MKMISPGRACQPPLALLQLVLMTQPVSVQSMNDAVFHDNFHVILKMLF